jgi:peptidyl-prolyl cis-trans isomerase C
MLNDTKWTRGWVAALCGGVALAMGTACTRSETDKAKPEAKTIKPAATPAPESAPSSSAIDPALVLVNVAGAKLTAGEADGQIRRMLGESAGQLNGSQLDALMDRFRQQVVERFVTRSLLSQEAEKRQIAVGAAEVDAAVETVKARLPQGLTFEEVLTREGMTVEAFRTNLVAELKIKTLVESEIPTNMVVAEADIAAFYAEQRERFQTPETVEARHILIKTEATDDEAAKAGKKAKIEGIHKQLVEGGDFEALAREHSECPSKDRGGSLGTFQRGQMVKPFEDAAFGLETNAISPVVETQFGYHVLQVTAHHAAKTNTLEDMKDQLAAHLKQRKQMERFEAFMDKLKAAATIEYADRVKPAAGKPDAIAP